MTIQEFHNQAMNCKSNDEIISTLAKVLEEEVDFPVDDAYAIVTELTGMSSDEVLVSLVGTII